MNSKQLIWILEDDPSILFVYQDILNSLYDVQTFQNLDSFIASAKEDMADQLVAPDLLITDLKLNNDSFVDFLTSDQSVSLLTCPFIVVSGADDLEILRICFEEGASDYLTKPFTKNELLVKVERLLRHSVANEVGPPSSIDGIVFDPRTLSLRMGGSSPVILTAKQVQIYSILDRANGKPVARETLEKELWPDVTVSAKSLDVHIFHLRQKLKKLKLQISWHPELGYALVPFLSQAL